VSALTGCLQREAAPPQAVVPAELVGAWNTVTERGNAFSYQISPDGRYVYVAIMSEGSQQYTLQEDGAVAVRGDEIVFTPRNTDITRTDPAEPTWRDSPNRSPRSMTWVVSGRTLTLTEDGRSTDYERE
jgi:hypothetical protein